MERMKVEEILNEQRRRQLTATIEEVEDDDDRVKVTPWAAERGCQCGLAVEVPKEAIASVDPIGERHRCCGKSFLVVDVEFVEGATIELADLFGQLMKRLETPHGDHGHEHAQDVSPAAAAPVAAFAPQPTLLPQPVFATPCGSPASQPAGFAPAAAFAPAGGFAGVVASPCGPAMPNAAAPVGAYAPQAGYPAPMPVPYRMA